jgi:hypothetical protein
MIPAMTDLITTRDWLTVYHLASYAHELNPAERVWSNLDESVPGLAKRNVGELAGVDACDVFQELAFQNGRWLSSRAGAWARGPLDSGGCRLLLQRPMKLGHGQLKAARWRYLAFEASRHQRGLSPQGERGAI